MVDIKESLSNLYERQNDVYISTINTTKAAKANIYKWPLGLLSLFNFI